MMKFIPSYRPSFLARKRRFQRSLASGQATTEVVLLMPLFLFFLFAFAKIFAVLILVQKMEIASYYAARRWQLESHRNVQYIGWDEGTLRQSIKDKVSEYLGYKSDTMKGFLGLQGTEAELNVSRTQVWNVVTLTVHTQPISTPYLHYKPLKFEVSKYVPNRDRPIAFVLPGLK